MNKKIVPGKVILEALSIILAVVFLTPVIWAFATSISVEGVQITNAFDWFLPPYTLENYPKILFDSAIPIWLFNSLLIAALSTILVLLLSSMAAYALAKIPFKGSKGLYLYFMLGMMVPTEAMIIPLFLTANDMGLIDTYAGLLLPTIAGSMNLIIMVTFFRGIPNELMEAARIDGAGNLTIFARIVLPLAKTVMVTVGIFAFIGSWNNYFWPLLCAMSEDKFTLPIGIPTFTGTYTVDYVMPMTANMVASIPAIIVYLLFERQITQGVALSGVKG